MNLLTDIQTDLINPDNRLSDTLRKARILAHRLDSQELIKWVDNELNGYTEITEMPEYRIASTLSFGHFFGPFGTGYQNAPIYTTGLHDELARYATSQYFKDSIREIEVLVKSERRNLHLAWPADYLLHLSEQYTNMQCLQAWKSIPVSAIEGILDIVRNKLLAFVLEIESINPDAGEKTTTSSPPIPKDKSLQVFQTHIYGSQNIVSAGSDFELEVIQIITPGNFDSLAENLRQKEVSEEDIKALEKAIKIDGERKKKDGFGDKVKNWISIMLDKATKEVWNISIQIASSYLYNVLANYYGWGP